MLFTSIRYALFLPTMLALYYAMPRRARPILLLLASYVFYASWNPPYLLMLLAMTGVNYLFGLWIARERDAGRSTGTLLGMAVAANVLVLGYFKYAGFLVGSAV